MAPRRSEVEEARKRYEARLAEQLRNDAGAPASGPVYIPPKAEVNEPSEGKAGPVYAPAISPSSAPVPTSVRAADPQPIIAGPTYNPDENTPQMRPMQEKKSLANFYTDSAVPLDETGRQRRAGPAPIDHPGARVIYDPKHPDRPMSVEGGADEYERQVAYQRALTNYKPSNHNNRFKSGAIQFGRGLLQGKGLMQSAAEGVGALIDPKMDEEYQNHVDLARTGRSIATEEARRKSQSDLYSDAVDRDHKRTQDEIARRGPVYAPELYTGDEGPVLVDKNKGTFAPVYNPDGSKKLGPKPSDVKPVRVERKNAKTGRREIFEVRPGNADKLVEVETADGLMVPPGTERTARATEENRTNERGYRDRMDNREVDWREEDKTDSQQKTFQSVKQHAGGLVGKLNSARERWKAADARISKLQERLAAAKTPEEKQDAQDMLDRYDYDRSIAAREAADAATELNTAHGDIYEAGPGEGGLAYYKLKPFHVEWWRKTYPKVSKAQMNAAIQNARELGQEVIFPKGSRANR